MPPFIIDKILAIKPSPKFTSARGYFHIRGFPKTSVFGKASLDLYEKAGLRPLFPELFPKLTEFWEKLTLQ
jgi:hypothetical protein